MSVAERRLQREAEAAEAKARFDKEFKELCDLYFRVFTTEDGARVLADLRKRSFVTRSIFADNAPEHIRNMREGQRSLVLEMEGFIAKAKEGIQLPAELPKTAVSDTAEGA